MWQLIEQSRQQVDNYSTILQFEELTGDDLDASRNLTIIFSIP